MGNIIYREPKMTAARELKKLPFEEGITGKFVIATEIANKDAIRLFGILYTSDQEVKNILHIELVRILSQIEGISLDAGLLIGGGFLEAHQSMKAITINRKSRGLGNVPKQILEKAAKIDGWRIVMGSLLEEHRSTTDRDIVFQRRNEDADQWYRDHGFEVK